MVSIRKIKKQQQGFQLRRGGSAAPPRRGGGSPYDPERVGLLAAGLCIGFLVVVLYSLTFSGNDGSAGHPRGIPDALRKMRQHPVLTEPVEEDGGEAASASASSRKDALQENKGVNRAAVQPMGDKFNAIALDIVDTLGCVKLLEEAAKFTTSRGGGLSGGGGGGFMDDDAMMEAAGGGKLNRRRLDETQQHGDDGGFGNEEDGGGALAAEAKAEEAGDDSIPEEKWGNEAAPEIVGGGGSIAKDGESSAGQGGWEGDDMPRFNNFGGGGVGAYVELTARHLFCLAASENPPDEVKKEVKCDASNSKRRTLLELWSAARSQMQKDILLKVLDLAREHPQQDLLGKSYSIWAPRGDEGLSYMISTLNSDKDVDNGGLHGLDQSLGPGKVFVDVGSCLGITGLAVTAKYPGTTIVSLEPASPNWLLQEMNLRCNLDHKTFKNFHVVLAGVGPNTEEEDNFAAKLMWRPTATTSTRAWTPSTEHHKDDIELVVRLRRLKSVLAEANVYDRPIDVLNVDCEGCEYNLIPALTQAEFEDIPTVMGTVHWGYIPTNKLPSSARGETTHKRLCEHENIAKQTKECCAFLDLPVRSSVPGELLVKDHGNKVNPLLEQQSTVSDVIADGLCNDFSTWAAEHFLNDVKDDWGWFELSAEA